MIHLIKLCVGIKNVDELIARRKMLAEAGHGRRDGLNVHRTRMTPKRRNELLDGGSLYWVMGGKITARQRIVDLVAATDHEGKSCCDILLDPEIFRTVPRPKRPFQGWRYLRAEDAPKDVTQDDDDALPPELAAELDALGLL
ncbi:DUF1489 family protein [Maritalea mediterranea]|uniref:DUF1489 domain-containing protein n=1 Tax=Maritalea mediterranea TaxID=2909667 RepID=A0ABS9EAL8_9HYPH|nr:DUF1489 domain-containing protein [Maritalea mediterranea]MCF4099908.1 DUF1489 domain-containing protein [Maritalea mediterranea]